MSTLNYTYLGIKALKCYWLDAHLTAMDKLHQKVKIGGLAVLEYEKVALLHKALDIVSKYEAITSSDGSTDNLITETQLHALISLVNTELGVQSPKQYVRGICNEIVPTEVYMPTNPA